MKKILMICAVVVGMYHSSNAQTTNVESAVVDLTDKSYESAKKFIDKAALNDETKNLPKMHYYRGYIHLKIALDTTISAKYPEACEIALRSFIECIKTDVKKKYEERMDEDGNPTGSITSMDNSAFQCYNKAAQCFEKKDYEGAMRCYNLILEAIPLDKGNTLEKNNITAKQIMLYNSYAAINAKTQLDEQYRKCSQDKTANCDDILSKKNMMVDESKKSLNKLIEQSYADPIVYIQMEQMQLSEGDTAGALVTIEKGLKVIENNKDLMNEELRIYQAKNDMNGLINKLSQSIQADPNGTNVGNYTLTRGNLYERKKVEFTSWKSTAEADTLAKRDKKKYEIILAQKMHDADSCSALAEADYIKCIEINQNDTFAQYSLGALYLQQGNPIIEKINALNEKKPDYKTRLDAYRAQLKALFEKSRPFLEKAYELKSDDYDIVFALQQLYVKLEMREKADEMRKKKETLKR